MGRAAVACVSALLAVALLPVGGEGVAHAKRRPKPTAAADTISKHPGLYIVTGPNAASAGLRPARTTVDPFRHALARAALEHARGNHAGVVDALAPLMLEQARPDSLPPDADRAVFLLGHAWLMLGQRERFVSLAHAVATWRTTSAYARWLGFEAKLQGDAQGEAVRTGDQTTDVLVASQLLRDGRADAVLTLVPAGTRDPLLAEQRAQALERLGRDARADWEGVAAADTSTALGRDLAGAALVRLATLAAERHDDPRAWLSRVSATSRYAAVARHMAALVTLEHGDANGAAAQLEALRASAPDYANRREVEQVLAGQAMDAEHWDDAFQRYAAADSDWARERAALTARLAPDSAASLWRAWEHDRSVADALVLDGLPAASLTERLSAAAADLGILPPTSEPALGTPEATPSTGPTLPPPPPGDWDRIADSARELAAARGLEALTADSLERERDRLSDLGRYLGAGLKQARGQADTLAENTSWLEMLEREMDDTAKRLMALRDDATLHFQRRATLVLERARLHESWLEAMEHFYLKGPDGARQAATPPQQKGPDVVLAQEQELARMLRFSAGHLRDESTKRIAQAYERTWGPRLIDRVGALADSTRGALVWSRAIVRNVDSSLALSATSAEEKRLAALEVDLARRTDERATADAKLRAGVARAAVERALAALDQEREGLDYGLAAASYARSVKLSAADTLPVAAAAAAATRTPAADSVGAVDTAADSAARHDRDEAIARASIFLADHPQSAARGEMRFRLADLLVSQARADFRGRMAAWVAAQAQGHTLPVPVVDHAQALELYRKMLAEDTDFPHLDAVLFNAGMLLADAGDPGASEFFARLLAEHPSSPYVQEASLRLGDLRTDGQKPDEGVADYERAAGGNDPSLKAIALYKSGWAHYNADRFDAAASAFRGVMDLYEGEAKLHLQTDIQHEAEQYFVYSLASAGGADAFAREFPAGGPERPYERRVLRAMGQHFRRYGELTKAAAADELYLDRWPGDPAALEVAARLADTEKKAERPDEERATRLKWADRVGPGGDWAKAQPSDSLRGAGEAFARDAWRTEAFEHHRDARAKGSRAEWQEALHYYETLLAKWPGDSAAATYQEHAGEASAELGDYAASLTHYRAAAAAAAGGRGAASDSVAARAAWQVVAVTDRWYESTREPAPAGASGSKTAARGPGADSLARAFVREADAFLVKDPRNPKAADLVWRECQLALAHGWNDEAQAGLARFARGFPGDKRAPLAAGERAEAYFKAGDFAAASDAFEEALSIAKKVGADTLARRAERALPVCAYARAEAAVTADSTQHAHHAELFEEVARRWPDYEHAPLAQYRAGLAWLDAGQTEKGVRALQVLGEKWPKNVLAREASLKSAQAWEAAGDKERASAAYVEFSQKFPTDKSADVAWLKAADLADSAGQGEHADNLRKEYLRRWPNDRESALEILEKLAHAELGTVSADKPLASLLAAPKRAAKGAAKSAAAAPPSYLAQYLKLAAEKPALASKPLLAEVRFQYAEEAYRRYDAFKLTQPLPKSIAAKQKLLDSTIVRYKRTVDLGVPEWSHAAGFRIGQALAGFGSALEASERPADLKGDDLKAYENVLIEQSMTFHERGETVWSDLLQRSQGGVADTWVTKTRQALWSRLGDRFLFEPDVDFPVVAGKAPPRARSARSTRDTASGVATEGER
jgi:outer membrane protein assembly factor BamD (BamD/ComL family)